MVGRIIQGNRGGTSGVFVSNPGVDVLTASDDNLMLATHLQSLQVVASGVIPNPGTSSTNDRGIPDLGFQPFIIWSCEAYVCWMEYLSNSLVRFRTFNARGLESSMAAPPALNGDIRYLVLNIPRP